MTTVVERCRGGEKKIDAFRRKLIIPDFEISECPECEVKSRIENIFWTKKYSKNILLRLMKLILIFMRITEKIQVAENGCKYILFRIDVYFYSVSLSRKNWWKGHIDRDLIFEEKRQKALGKKLCCKFIRLNTSSESNDANYEASRYN